MVCTIIYLQFLFIIYKEDIPIIYLRHLYKDYIRGMLYSCFVFIQWECCLVSNIVQNIFFGVLQRKESHTDLK